VSSPTSTTTLDISLPDRFSPYSYSSVYIAANHRRRRARRLRLLLVSWASVLVGLMLLAFSVSWLVGAYLA
jgi:hypothetical protein